MKLKLNSYLKLPIATILVIGLFAFIPGNISNGNILSYTVNTETQDLRFYWKDDKGLPFRSIQNLKTWLEAEGQNLVFAMNGGMYKRDNSPQGLYIENSAIKAPLDTLNGNGNFYLKPNGVFFISVSNKAFICRTEEVKNSDSIKFATQSGPMLLIGGQINSKFQKGSKNLNIRNGVGILPDGKVIFAISKIEINFYDFADFFKNAGCKNALYLDGFVSRAFIPQQEWKQTDGNFGVLISVIEKAAKN